MTRIKSPIKGKLDLLQISKSREPQFYTYVLEFGLGKYPAPHHFLNRDNRQTKKKFKYKIFNMYSYILYIA